MKKRVGLNSVVSTGVLLGSLGVGLGFNSARAEPIHSPVLSLEDSLKVIEQNKTQIPTEVLLQSQAYDNVWDIYCDNEIRNYMNVPLYDSYTEFIPLVDENNIPVAYFMIYAGFRDTSKQNVDIFTGFVASENPSNGMLRKLNTGYTRFVVVYGKGVFSQEDEVWCKEQTCYAQRMQDDSLKKINLEGRYQTKLVGLGIDLGEELLTSNSEIVKVLRTVLKPVLKGVEFLLTGSLPGQLETDLGGQYAEPIVAEGVTIYPPLDLTHVYAVKARDTNLSWRSTMRKRPKAIYMEIKLQRTWIHEGLLKLVDFGIGPPGLWGIGHEPIRRLWYLPQRG